MSLSADMLLAGSLQVVNNVDENGQTVYYFKVLKGYYDYNIKKCDSSRLVELNIDETGEYYIISLEDMKALLKDMYKSIIIDFFPRFDKKMEAVWKKCKEKVDKLYQKLEFLNDDNAVISINNKDIMNFIDYNSAITNVSKCFWYFEELYFEKDKLLYSLKFFCSSEELKSFDDEYSKSIVDCDIPKLKLLLKNAQSKIFEHWTGATTNIEDYKSGMPFRFLCHSVTSSHFSGTFHTKFVSASLLTEKLMYTYKEGYGFILEPSSLIAASDKDIGVYNEAENVDDLYSHYGSIILPAQSPEEILENCYKRAESQVNLYEKIYSEIVIEGFKPIGIFAITDGSKELNTNYRGAYELQKSFPNLHIIEIDKTLYYVDDENKHQFTHHLIHYIKMYKEKKNIKYRDHYLLPIEYYNGFFQEFMELKKSDDYIVEDILELFDKHEALFFEVDLENLFENYNDEELYTIFNYSDYLGMNDLVFYKQYDFVVFNKVYDRLKNYAGDTRLDKYVSGLSLFLTLMESHPNLTESDWAEINEAEDLEQVNMILARALGINSGVESDEHMLDSDTPMDSSGQNKLVLKIG